MLYSVEGEEGRTAEAVGRGYTDGRHERWSSVGRRFGEGKGRGGAG
jgi:hypothetical protein